MESVADRLAAGDGDLIIAEYSSVADIRSAYQRVRRAFGKPEVVINVAHSDGVRLWASDLHGISGGELPVASRADSEIVTEQLRLTPRELRRLHPQFVAAIIACGAGRSGGFCDALAQQGVRTLGALRDCGWDGVASGPGAAWEMLITGSGVNRFRPAQKFP